MSGDHERCENDRTQSPALPAGGTKILDAFKKLLGEKEFATITIADIVNTSGVNSALIYKYFGDKRGILHRVLADEAEKHLSVLERDLKGIKGALNKLRKLVWTQINLYAEIPIVARILLLEVRNHHSYFESEAYRTINRYSSMLKEVIEEGVKDGDIRDDIPVRSIRQVLTGAVEHLCLPGVIRGRAFSADALTEDLCNIILSGIEKRK
ncbi:MAG: TetR/AcrR family transcriptional regulator [Deltaproteobacteria bacterium]|nr:TetR/AcrR family transcriptional regulator [Deltaproteobacteria bacterium]